MPKVSVIMPAYNAEKYIKEAIDSILNQTFKDFEFIIIDDGSTDGTKEIISSYQESRIKLLENDKNLGLVGSLNKGLQIARGEYIARMDADDIALPERLEKQVDFLDKNQDIVLVGSWIDSFDEESKDHFIVEFASDPIIIKWLMVTKNQLAHASVVFRKEIIEREGGYSNKYEHAEDYELWSRLLKNYKIANIPEVLLKHRIHGESVSVKRESHNKQIGNVKELVYENIKRYIDLNKQEYNIFMDTLKNDKNRSFGSILNVRRIYKKIFKSFIKKENLTKKDIDKIFPIYKKNKRMVLKWLIKI